MRHTARVMPTITSLLAPQARHFTTVLWELFGNVLLADDLLSLVVDVDVVDQS